MYLLTSKPDEGGQAVYDYTEITDTQQRRIEHLTQTRKLPDSFVLGEKTIISSEIVGFTKTDAPIPRYQPKFKNFDELRDWVQKQKWYRTNSKRVTRELRETSESPSQSSLL